MSAGKAPTITAKGQDELAGLLERHRVQRLVTSDYDLYGAIEAISPEISVTHTWAAISRAGPQRKKALPSVLERSANGHYLVVRPSAPMIYNLSPTPDEVLGAAVARGLNVTPVETLHDAHGEWAWLYALGAAKVGADSEPRGVAE